MRRLMLLSSALLITGCAKKEEAAPPPPPPPAGIALADVAGTWHVKTMNEAGDSVTGFTLVATADTAGWTVTFPNRPAMPMRVVAVGGDSIVTETGPYESVLRRGVQVRTRGVNRLVGGKLVGMTVAHYSVRTADSVVNLRTEGTKAP